MRGDLPLILSSGFLGWKVLKADRHILTGTSVALKGFPG